MGKNILRVRTTVILAVVFAGAELVSGCKANNTTKGGAIGAGVGGAIGGVIGSRSNNTAIGAIIGATVGGATGALIGRHMDKQAEELKKDLQGATVERVGEGIKITFDSGLMFDFDSYTLKAATKENLAALASTLKKYDDTNILIEGHTDKSGDDNYNLKLSRERADAVESYLEGLAVQGSRITTTGYGESQPVSADNDALNRRVEVAIYANKKMKKLAEKGELGK